MQNPKEQRSEQNENVPDLEYLMRRYGDHVVRLAYSYLRDSEEAKDAAQEVFLRTFSSFAKFRGKPVPYTWIYRVTVNLCRDRLRKKCRLSLQQFSCDSLASSINTEEQVLQNFAEKALFDAVMELPVKYREVIVLFYLYQFDTEKIAEITGVKRSLVKVRLYRARQQLREILLKNRVISDE
ncbi:MAG: sigma-70 family RNA polymerase sigma factor [Bacillota bacterium]|jgi:RNA polymerase sigma-70 factor (ECF subfamily)|nr:sigma-70 family RNA polymerase sigma factor [Bacillota bacterium]HHU30993.1 sigma-70 family RNA polymerase sigma factor [Bacillota bacterium]